MSGTAHRPAIRRLVPALHWPSIRGRARADAGPLLLAAAIVAAVTVLAGAVPPWLGATADAAVHDAVRRAGVDADVLVRADWERDDGPTGGRIRMPRIADDVDALRRRASDALGPDLGSVLRPPVAVVTSQVLSVTDGSVLRTFQLAYLAGDSGGPDVVWIAGGPPRSTPEDPARSVEIRFNAPPWPVQVGLSEADAAALGLRPGDHMQLKDVQQNVKDVRVSGVFRPADAADPAWRLTPALLHPVPGADGTGTTRTAGLLSRESLPDARLAFDAEQLQRTVRFAPQPDALTRAAAPGLARTVVELKATSGSSGSADGSLRWESQLDAVLHNALTQIDAAQTQASVLLAGILLGAALVLFLAADLLIRRRAPVLTAARRRGAGLPTLGAELFLEAAGTTLLAAAAGLALARALAPGVSWTWAVPVVVAAATAGPALGVLTAARATRNRRQPANRVARLRARDTSRLRRAAVEAAVAIAAAAAFTALHQRGLTPAGSALPVSAPALGALAAALVLLRLFPAGARLALRRALRTDRPLAVFGAARAAETSSRALPLLALVTATALASFALVLAATAGQGLADGAWRTVGADARLDVAASAEASTRMLAERAAAAPGVQQVVTAQVTDRARLIADSTIVAPRLVVVDATAFQRLLATTPLPDAPALARLTAAGAGPVPALVRSQDGSLRPGMRLQLPRDNAPAIDLAAVGTAPAVGDADAVVIVDAARLAAAGLPATPNTVWVQGPGAARALSAVDVAATVVLRSDTLRERRAAPLTSGLLRLAWTAAVVLVALALLGFALGAAAGAADRWQTLTRLRTLGVRPREARWIAVGELSPAAAVAAIGGPLLGLLLAALTFSPLELGLLTGQAEDPPPAWPWWQLGLVTLALIASVAAVVPLESAIRRRQRLAEVLRVGT
ncbi:FtsX-like permease family protein [Dactylosporangium sp. CA-139066]|uniref:FtsX-like permease family protein n=1 Tax=Dactylosporangium sp. CA-139066 TaxID=3239930 RepID=UPI003D8C01D6